MNQKPAPPSNPLDNLKTFADRLDGAGPATPQGKRSDSFAAVRKADPARADDALVTLSTRITRSRWRAIRRYAVEHDTSSTAILSTLVDEFLKRENIPWDE